MDQPIKLLFLSLLDLVFVVEVLPSTSSIFPYRLKHPAGRRVDGNFDPGGRDAKELDSFLLSPGNRSPVSLFVVEASLRSAQAPYARQLKSLKVSHSLGSTPFKHARTRLLGASRSDSGFDLFDLFGRR
jgi:hypothetical protein